MYACSLGRRTDSYPTYLPTKYCTERDSEQHTLGARLQSISNSRSMTRSLGPGLVVRCEKTVAARATVLKREDLDAKVGHVNKQKSKGPGACIPGVIGRRKMP